MKSFSDSYYIFPNKIELNKRIIIALNNKDLFFGESTQSENYKKIKYKWIKYRKSWYEEEIKELNDEDIKYIRDISGFFIFEGISTHL